MRAMAKRMMLGGSQVDEEQDDPMAQDEHFTALEFWPRGRLSSFLGHMPTSFKDGAVEASFRQHNVAAIRKSLAAFGKAACLIHAIGILLEALSLGITQMNGVRIQYLCIAAIPLFLLAISLVLVRIPEAAVPAVILLAEASMLVASKTRFSIFFTGASAQITFGDPDFPASSDSVTVMNISLLILAYFAVMPVRSKLSVVLLPAMPSLYFALSLPVDGLEAGSVRIAGLAFRLLVLCFIGLFGRVVLEIRERHLFFRLAATQKKLVKEKVLRFEAENIAEHIAEHAAEQTGRSTESGEDGDDLQSSADRSVISSGMISSMVLTPPADLDLDVPVWVARIAQLGVVEGWLLHPQDVEWNPDDTLGSGGFGVVYRGKYAGGLVALKMPKEDKLSTSKDLTNAVTRELRTLRNISHPCIVTFYGATIDVKNNSVILIEELIDGRSMKSFILKYQTPDNVKWQFLRQLMQALAYLHRQDPAIMHGDVKPSNAMIMDGTYRLKLIDFGLSLHIKPGKISAGGSYRYMAPEHLRGKACCSGDIFAFGRLVYFVATGKEPLHDIDKEAMIQISRRQEVPSLQWPDDSTLIMCSKDLCDACLRPASEDRPTADAALDVLKSWPFHDAPSSTMRPVSRVQL